MRDRLTALPEPVEVVLVTFSTAARAAEHRSRLDLPFPVLIDPDRSVYRAYGLGRGSVGRVWGARALRRYGELLRRDGLSGLHRPTEDTLQLGGDFVVAPDGTLAWGHWGAGPDDRPSIDDIAAAVALAPE